MAWPTGWSCYQVITLPAVGSMSGSSLSDVPYLITNLPDAVYAGARADGGDIRFSTSDGVTQLPCEVRAFDATGKTCVIYLLAPTISKSSTNDVRIYYGAASETTEAANSTYGKYAVWKAGSNADYALVMGLGEAVNNNANGYADATENANHGTGTSMALTEVTGKIGKAQDFDGSADYISCADAASLSPTSITISAWVKRDATGVFNRIMNKQSSNGNHFIWGMQFSNGNNLQFIVTSDNQTNVYYGLSTGTVTDTNWHFCAVTYDAATNTATIYIDGVASGSGQPGLTGFGSGTLYSGNLVDSSGVLDIGKLRFNSASYYHDGKIDTVRVTGAVRSADWLFVEYYQAANQSAPTYGGEVSLGGVSVVPVFGGRAVRRLGISTFGGRAVRRVA